jgi:hypothetical protein
VLPVNGALHVAERFAIDFVQLDDNGLMFDGPATSFDSYDFFGDPILSATAGKVVRVVNDLPETPAGTFPQGITAAQAGGNHVVVAMGKGRFAFYAHLQPGSVRVKVGDPVKTGPGRSRPTGCRTASAASPRMARSRTSRRSAQGRRRSSPTS